MHENALLLDLCRNLQKKKKDTHTNEVKTQKTDARKKNTHA